MTLAIYKVISFGFYVNQLSHVNFLLQTCIWTIIVTTSIWYITKQIIAASAHTIHIIVYLTTDEKTLFYFTFFTCVKPLATNLVWKILLLSYVGFFFSLCIQWQSIKFNSNTLILEFQARFFESNILKEIKFLLYYM